MTRRSANATPHGQHAIKVSIAAMLVAIERCDGNVSELSRRSGVERTSIHHALSRGNAMNMATLVAIANGCGLSLPDLVRFAEHRVELADALKASNA